MWCAMRALSVNCIDEPARQTRRHRTGVGPCVGALASGLIAVHIHTTARTRKCEVVNYFEGYVRVVSNPLSFFNRFYL